MLTETPFDDLVNLIGQLPEKDAKAEAILRSKLQHVTVGGSQNEPCLTDWLDWLSAWQGASDVSLKESHICLFTSSYKNADGVDDVTSFADKAGTGQTPLNQLCKDRGLGLRVLELAPTLPHDLNEGWAERDCMAACAFGMEATASGGNLLGLSAVSAGADEVARDLILALEGLSTQKPAGKDVLNCMKELAGREIAALVGAMIAARSRRLPVLAEGWPALSAMKVLYSIDPATIAHVSVASVTDEAQKEIMESIGKKPMLALASDLPAGCGIAVAISALLPLINLT